MGVPQGFNEACHPNGIRDCFKGETDGVIYPYVKVLFFDQGNKELDIFFRNLGLRRAVDLLVIKKGMSGNLLGAAELYFTETRLPVLIHELLPVAF